MIICGRGVLMSGEEKIPTELFAALPRRNNESYTLLKVLLRYCVIFALAFTAGILFCRASADIFPDMTSTIQRFFTDVFAGCESCRDYFTVIISASSPDIRCLILLFATGFTYFCGIATSTLVLCRGFAVGFSLQYLLFVIESGAVTLSHPTAAAVIFGVTELALAGVMIWLSTKSLIFGYDFRRLRGRRSRIVRSPIIYLYMLLYLTAFGLILIINTSSCFITMLIYR